MQLFKIGDLDVTPFIVLNSYEVSKQPEYVEWKDGNSTLRRGIKRWKLKGSFNVKFFNKSDYSSFLSAIETQLSSQTGGYNYALVYDNKTRTNRNAYVFLDFEPPNVEPSIGTSFNEEITIDVTER